MRRLLVLVCALVALAAGGLYFVAFPAIKPTHATLQKAALPDLIPLRDFFAERQSNWRYRLSPDGTRMAWLSVSGFRPALFVRPIDGSEADVFQTDDEVRWYVWSADGRYLLYQADRDGWENDQIVSIDVSQPDATPRTYDFGRNVKSWIQFVPPEGGAEIVVAHNAREPALFDYYVLNLDTGETELLHQQDPFQRESWGFDRSGKPFTKSVQSIDGQWGVEIKMDGRWRSVARGGMEDDIYIVTEPDADGWVYAVSNLKRDTSKLVRREIVSGREEEVSGRDAVDVSWLMTHPVTQAPIAVVTYDGRQQLDFLDPAIEEMVAQIDRPDDASLHLVSATRDFSKAIWEVEDDREGWSKFLVDVSTGNVSLISEPPIKERAQDLVAMEPVSIPAQDGLSIPAYVWRPNGVAGPAPTVVLIHGGPVARVRWGFHAMAQMLANRGYAVLDVNYRGSEGYGRAFRETAVGEVSRKMHQDIVDARAWAVEQGIADPDRVAVLGGSFGGLKTFTAMTESPALFAAGVSINGVSDLSTMLDEVPPYWTGWPAWYRKYLGDPSKPNELADIKARSPLYNVENIAGPILVIQGSNDVRVIQNQGDRMVEAMRAAGKDVRYEVIEGAGHTFANMGWKQRILMYRTIERFLAKELGGRADGFDYAVLGAMVLPK